MSADIMVVNRDAALPHSLDHFNSSSVSLLS